MGKRIKHYEDYIDQVHQKFPEYSIEDLTKIIQYGSRSLYKILCKRGDIFLDSLIDKKRFKILLGRVNFKTVSERLRYAKSKAVIRFRYLFKEKNLAWDGYYYMGFTDEALEEVLKFKFLKNPDNYIKNFFKKDVRTIKNIRFYKILDECLLNTLYKHIFRVKTDIKFKRPTFFLPTFTSKDIEYYLKRTFDGYEYMIDNDEMTDLKNFNTWK